MKIVSFGDIHMATRNLARMREVLRDADLVIISGDLTNFGGIDDARRVLDSVRSVFPKILALPGNLDRPEVLDLLEEQGVALHGKGVSLGEVGIFGCGGSNMTPFGTPLEFSEEEILRTLRQGYEQVRAQRALLMVCHTPPYETKCDRLPGGRPVGSMAARRFIEEVRPHVCISGHIHESVATDAIGPTAVVNAGPFKGGGYVVVTNNGGGLSASLEFL